MEPRSCHRFNPVSTVTGAPRIVEWGPLVFDRADSRSGFVPCERDFTHSEREEQISRCSIDRPSDDKQPFHNTSRQKYLPALIDEE
jgi:hypothetical protein